jgi:thioredoxin
MAATRHDSPEALTVHLTEATFDEAVAASDTPLLVDFWAPWCGPCRAIAPVLEEIARERAGRVTIAKVNVDEQPALAGRFGVQAIPTLLFVKNGQVAQTLVGAVPKQKILASLDALAG